MIIEKIKIEKATRKIEARKSDMQEIEERERWEKEDRENCERNSRVNKMREKIKKG